ncbi:MAG TPA: MerR family transcriptional regulator [Ohtaekwangia sp.]|nr:MerR family transcriptional regulator [Ohtaekwangia sp.]
MGKYSIKDLEQLSGIKAHTIRIWEKRHGIIAPARTPTNIRYYSDDDLKKIINVSLLNSNGVKISRIADMTTEELNQKVLELSETQNEAAIHIDQLVVAMIDMAEEAFEKVLNTLILRYGFEKAITTVVYPFLEKIGILWQTHNISPAHEHFISNLIRQKLIVAIDGLQIPSKDSKKVVLFLPEGEMHEIGLLFFHYLARRSSLRTYYLGQSVPHADLVTVVNIHKPDFLVSSITTSTPAPVEDYFELLRRDFPGTPILISGQQVQKFNGTRIGNIQTFRYADEILQLLEK